MTETPPPRRAPGRRVGLLGGSFNPAHDGHLHISILALRALGLDEVWWLVSPQNPLKPDRGMASFAARVGAARALARHPRIVVSDLERRLGTRYTADTLDAVKRRFPRTAFVWLMGADNLVQIPRWKDWTAIFARAPIAVFDRPSYCYKALAGRAARRYARERVDARRARKLAVSPPPAWVFVRGRLNAACATEIRGAAKPSADKARSDT